MTSPAPRTDDASSLSGTIGRLRRDIARYIPGFIVPAMISAVHMYVFTRVFEPVEFGRYSLVFGTGHVLTLFLAGWMTQSVLRYLPRFREEDRMEGFMGALGWLLLRFTAIVVLVLLVVFALVSRRLGEYQAYVPAAIVMVATGLDYMVLKMVYQTDLRSTVVARYHILYALGRIGASLVFVFYIERSAVGLIVGSALAYVILVPALVIGLRLIPRMRADHAARPRLFGMFASYGFPMIGWLVGAKIIEIADRYVIELVRGSDEVGVYSASYNLVAMAMWLTASPVLTAAYPLTIRAWESGDRSQIQALVSEFSRHYLLVAVPLAVILCVVARDIVSVFLGQQFRDGFVVVPLVAVGLLLWNFGFYGDKGLRLAERTRLVFSLVMLCAVANVVLNLFLVPSRGYYGAAIATLASSALYPLVVWVASRRVLAWRIPWLSLSRIVVSAGAGGAAAVASRALLSNADALPRLVVCTAAAAITYGLSLWVTRELSVAEKRTVLRLIGMRSRSEK